jgi:hypothetical protein
LEVYEVIGKRVGHHWENCHKQNEGWHPFQELRFQKRLIYKHGHQEEEVGKGQDSVEQAEGLLPTTSSSFTLMKKILSRPKSQ